MDDRSGNNRNEDGNEQRQDIEGLEYKKSERRRRGWGMGRAQGKMTGKMGEKVEIIEDRPGKEGLEGVGVGAVNVYLVVFADGIISVSHQFLPAPWLINGKWKRKSWRLTYIWFSSISMTFPNTPTESLIGFLLSPTRIMALTGLHTVSSTRSSTPFSQSFVM